MLSRFMAIASAAGRRLRLLALICRMGLQDLPSPVLHNIVQELPLNDRVRSNLGTGFLFAK